MRRWRCERSAEVGGAGWWLAGLVPLAVAVQMAVQEGAPPGYGLAKWAFVLVQPGSSGYYTVAKNEVRDLPAFLAAYPDWIKRQDALHIGTHPPGLVVASWAILRAMERHPELSCASATSCRGRFTSGSTASRPRDRYRWRTARCWR